MYNTSCVYGVNYPARCLSPQKGLEDLNDMHRFVVGTCSLHESNEISIVQYYADSNHLENVGLYSHPDQVSMNFNKYNINSCHLSKYPHIFIRYGLWILVQEILHC